MDIGAPELIIVLVIVILVFGVGRVASLGGEMGKAIRAFRAGLQPDEMDKPAGTGQEKRDGEPSNNPT